LLKSPFSLVHLFPELLAIFDDTRSDHFPEQVVAFPGTLAHAGKNGIAVVSFGNIVDELHDDDRLTNAGPSEQANLAALQIRLEQVNHFDACNQNLFLRL